MTVKVTRVRLFFQRFLLGFCLGHIGIRLFGQKDSVGSLIGKPKTSQFQNASILKFAPLKVVWGLFDTEKKLYKCPFGPEPIAGAKIPERYGCLLPRSAATILHLQLAENRK